MLLGEILVKAGLLSKQQFGKIKYNKYNQKGEKKEVKSNDIPSKRSVPCEV